MRRWEWGQWGTSPSTSAAPASRQNSDYSNTSRLVRRNEKWGQISPDKDIPDTISLKLKNPSLSWSHLHSKWNCTISKYTFQNSNEIVWRKSEKFGYEAQPSIQIFHDFWRLFHENSEKCTRMSAISDKHNDWTHASLVLAKPVTLMLWRSSSLICETDSLGLADYLRILINNILPPGLIGASLL